MPPLPILLAGILELLLLLGGGIVLWRISLAPTVRKKRLAPRLGTWPVRSTDFLLLLWIIVMAAFLVQVLTATLSTSLGVPEDIRPLVAGFGFQAGMLLGCVYYRFLPRNLPPDGANLHPPRNAAAAGAMAFLVIMPLATMASLAWQAVLNSLGLPVEPQSLVDLFSGDQPKAVLVVLVIFAVVLAPVTEELIFRAGLFRFLRTRVPRSIAYIGPAALFASLHVNWSTLDGLAAFAPLVVLGIVFSLAYERTGSIAVPMVAHGLFNLNTILLIFAGVPTEF